jgi:hypothetical protein
MDYYDELDWFINNCSSPSVVWATLPNVSGGIRDATSKHTGSHVMLPTRGWKGGVVVTHHHIYWDTAPGYSMAYLEFSVNRNLGLSLSPESDHY